MLLVLLASPSCWAQEKAEVNKWMPSPGTPNICVGKLNMQEKEPTISLLMPMQPGWTMDYSVEVPVVDADGKPVLRADGTPAIQTETRTKTIKKLEMDRRELIVTQFVFQTVAGKKLGIEEVKTEFAKPRHVIFGAVPHPYYAEVLKDDVIVILQKPPQSRNSQPR